MHRTSFSVKALNTAILFIAFCTIGIVICQGQEHFVVPTEEIGDLEIVDVKQLPVVDQSCGPRFGIVIANHSNRCVKDFHVTAIGSLGRALPHSPHTTVVAGEIPAQGALQVEVSLPIETLAMGNRGGLIIGMQHLTVVIDSWDEFFESNEWNNRKCFSMDSLPIEVTEAVSVETTATSIDTSTDTIGVTTTQTVPAESAVVPATGPATTPTPSTPVTNQVAPVASTADPLRSALDQMAPQASTDGQ
ncbi:hypothetical protein [Rhodopirellula halodulae]|uniref:hypothetical protein n=1 Tax=Rhodopirellula halodulae TaxID=2894198 RepID=UPI001E6514F1|nr:hypothetical protein [Rhodopirellula sp. JC737]MCC9657347.1 hypothetical protein [Rhodopirellula sp. JC737]